MFVQIAVPMSFDKCLKDMSALYVANPVKAVRSQKFIQTLHGYIAEEIWSSPQ